MGGTEDSSWQQRILHGNKKRDGASLRLSFCYTTIKSMAVIVLHSSSDDLVLVQDKGIDDKDGI